MLNAERFKEKILDVVEDDKKYNFAIKDDEKVIEDVKGLRTPVYNIKKKLFEYKFKTTIKET